MGIIIGVSLVVVGTCGDLIESLIKRDIGIKDMSSFLPGHGGVMDRLDSLLVAAPVAWLIMYILVPGWTIEPTVRRFPWSSRRRAAASRLATGLT